MANLPHAAKCSEYSGADGGQECEEHLQDYNSRLHYMIYTYREALRSQQAQFLKLSKIKLDLTDNLILDKVQNIQSLPTEEITAMNRQMDFKRELSSKIKKIRKLQKLGLKNINPDAISTDL